MTNMPNDRPAGTKPAPRIGDSLKAVALSPQRWAKILLTLAAIAVAIFLIAVLGKWLGAELPRFELWIKSLGWWGPAAFVLAFVILTTVQVPESFLAIASGVAFGLWEGFAAVVVSSVIAALFSFYVYRLVFRDRLEGMLRKHPKARAIEAAVSSEGFRLLVLLRLGPFNYSLLNAILGASNVRVTPFMLSMIGAIPGNFATVYFGTVAKHMAQKSAGTDNLSTAHEIVMLVGFVVTIVVFLFIGHVARHALEEVEAKQGEG